MNQFRKTLALWLAPLALVACVSSATAATIQVVKSPYCGCCTHWIDYLRASGFEVEVTETEEVAPVAARLGVPEDLRSCHTASIEGYAIEGHVPAEDIRRLLEERPAAAGLSVPGMPIGSPGMEQGDRREPYVVLLFRRDGGRSVFSRH